MPALGDSDEQLVEWSRTGDREAFGRIVERYQSLVCSITYGATGSLSWSEDLAQETFVTAWKQLTQLREPTKLRSWLCGIARNLLGKELRRRGHEPVDRAEPLDTIHETPAPEPLPSTKAISQEEQAILWRVLEQLPSTYREPLILFYRQDQSVAEVARTLDLAEDAVKQRLSRGRAMLTDQVAAFVESALKQTTPGKAFTLSVLAALPAMTLSAKAAMVGVAAAKGSAAAKAAAGVGVLNAILGPLLIVFGNYASYRMIVEQARSDAEREYIRGFYRRILFCVVGFAVVLAPLIFWAILKRTQQNSMLIAGLIGLWGIAYITAMAWFSISSFRRRRELLAAFTAQGITSNSSPAYEYRSQLELLGLPLIHIRLGGGIPSQRVPVKAWFAAGDLAIGVLVAFGGVAIAPFSIGGLAIGLLPFGGAAMGLLALGGFAIGMWSWGGFAVGWQAFGGCAVAWNGAWGGVAIAREYALGGFSLALQSNNAVAAKFMDATMFFRLSQVASRYAFWANVLWVAPLVWSWRVVAKARQR